MLLALGFMLIPLLLSRTEQSKTLPVEEATSVIPAPTAKIFSSVVSSSKSIDPRSPLANGILLIALPIWLLMQMLTWYHRSYYFIDEERAERKDWKPTDPYTTPTYEVSSIFFDTRDGDLTLAFLRSEIGELLLRRIGVSVETIQEYLSKRSKIVNFAEYYGDLRKVFTLRDVVQVIIAKDGDLYAFLFGLGIRDREILDATAWIERLINKKRFQERFWGKTKLGETQAFGGDWSYGGAYVLGKFGRDLSKLALSGGSAMRNVHGTEQVAQLEVILSRSNEANALLVGEEGVGKEEVLLDFARDIMNGFKMPELAGKRVMELDTKSLLANMRNKSELESELLRIFNDVVASGNIILVLEDLPFFIQGGEALESDVMALLDRYLASNQVQIIATADNSRFHQMIEPNGAIMRRFEKVLLVEPEEEKIIAIIEENVVLLEKQHPIFFTYPAVIEIVRSAEHYITDGVMPDKAISLLIELTPDFLMRGGSLVKKLDVLEFVHRKTNIPVGEIGTEEQQKLLHLEELMHAQVIGQEEAITVIANAMRRSRAGVRNQERPIGAFLFLGPTGVGKTETAKALANVFFGNSDAMSRIDMSEYQGDDGLERMIGSADGEEVGTLPVVLKEKPYGVLLLDEFEKTNPKVLDLFLQVFDEGVFHDALGKKVNARNVIIIATSNAGAQVIRDSFAQGKSLVSVKEEVVNKVIETGKFKPELLNRFDGVVLFHPLNVDHYAKIARFMLEKLAQRLREKNINLTINQPLLDAVMSAGVHPEFGARPMSRAVQEIVEQRIAEKIIQGKLIPGSTVTFTPEELGLDPVSYTGSMPPGV